MCTSIAHGSGTVPGGGCSEERTELEYWQRYTTIKACLTTCAGQRSQTTCMPLPTARPTILRPTRVSGSGMSRRWPACQALCPGRISDYSTNPPTEPYVKISLIRFLGTARFHTARLSALADHPRHPSPSALQHVFSRLFRVLRSVLGIIPSLSRSWAGAAGTLPSSAQTLATSSSSLHGGSTSTARRALPCSTPGPGTGCYTVCRSTDSILAASHTMPRTVPGADGGGCPGTNARTRLRCGAAACPPSSV